MRKIKILLAGVGVLLCAMSAGAQVITGSEFTRYANDTFSDLGNSMSNYALTWEDFSHGTIGPSAMLSGYGGINFYTDETRRMTIGSDGNIGIGTDNPEAPFTVSDHLPNGLGNNKTVTAVFWTGADVNLLVGGDLNGMSTPYLQSRANGSANSIGPSNYDLALDPYGGNVGIGTVSPNATLEVNGNLKLTSGSGGSITFADGTVQSTAYTGVACGGDYAESVDVNGNPHHYTPGDVLVISSALGSDVEKPQTAYSTEFVGVYSTKPGYVGRRFTGPKSKQEVPMAMIGVVPIKVTDENGPIHRGDLLVTSSMPGYAMKGTDRTRMLGAIVGKALGSLDSGRGVIEAFVTLQ